MPIQWRVTLARPPMYFPPLKGRYTVTPDLLPLTTDFGNGALDGCLFQIDENFAAFRKSKLAARAAHPERHVLFDDFSPVGEAVCALFARRLLAEWPEHFSQEGGGTLLCRLTGERVALQPPWEAAFDALCCQVSEDVAIVRQATGRGEWNAALHICAPSHWRPEEKIGRGYADTHAPVPGIERQKAAAASIVELFVTRGPFVRFTWGVSFDDRLNQHPDLEKAPFDPARLFFRVERQTLWPIPEARAALFAIRLHLCPLASLSSEKRALLREALFSMSPEARAYKGLAGHFDAIIAAISAPPPPAPAR